MIHIALLTSERIWHGNRIFDVSSAANRNHVAHRWIALRETLAAHGYALNTHDTYADPAQVDLWWVQDLHASQLRELVKRHVNPHRIILGLHEPPVIHPLGWRLYPLLRHLVRGTLTWHSTLGCDDPHLHRYHFPVYLDNTRRDLFMAQEKIGVCLMMHSNRTCRHPGELYTCRRRFLRYFDQRGDNLLNLYGYGWNDKTWPRPFHTACYRGTTDDKYLTYAQHRFAVCIDNSVVPGYITYDPFIAMAVGTVPVYLPMTDAGDYIPDDTYINIAAFDSLDALVDHLIALAADEEAYEGYRRRGWAFVNSPAFAPFTIETFCREMFEGIDRIWTSR